MFTEVLVPYNGSDDTTRALEIGAGLAQSADANLRILAYKRVRDKAAITESVVEKAFEIGRKYEVNPHLTTLEPKRFLSDAIIAKSAIRPGSLVCMASRGRGRGQLLLGSVSSEVLRYGTGAVVLCGPACESEFFEHNGPMIAALDGSRDSEELRPIAQEIATAFGLTLIVADLAPQRALVAASAAEDGESRAPSTHATYELLPGKPARSIVEAARSRDASLIAIATRTPRFLERLLQGSVTDEVVRRSPVPVLVYCAHPFWTARFEIKK